MHYRIVCQDCGWVCEAHLADNIKDVNGALEALQNAHECPADKDDGLRRTCAGSVGAEPN